MTGPPLPDYLSKYNATPGNTQSDPNDYLNRYNAPTPVAAEPQQQKLDGMFMRTVKNLEAGVVGAAKSYVNLGQKLGSGLESIPKTQLEQSAYTPQQVNDKIDNFTRSIQPMDGPEGPSTMDKIVRGAGNVIGQLPLFGTLGAKVGTATDAVLSYAPTFLRNRAAQAVIDVTKGITNPQLQAGVQAALGAVPSEVASGVTTQAAIDPNSVSTPQGLAMAAGMSAAGTIFTGIQGWKAANPNPVVGSMYGHSIGPQPVGNFNTAALTPDEARAAYAQFVGKIEPPKVGFWESLKDGVSYLDQKLFNGKAAFSKVEGQVEPKVDFQDAANLLSGSSRIVHESVFEVPLKVDDATGAWVKGEGPGLTNVLEVIPEEELGLFKGYLLARHRLDAGVEGQVSLGKYKHPDANGDLARLATIDPPFHFVAAADMFDDINKVNLKNRLSTDMITFQDYDWMEQNYPMYASASRSLANSDKIATMSTRKGGSEDHALNDPVNSYIAAVNQTVTRGRINQFANKMYDQWLQDPQSIEHLFSPKSVKSLATQDEIDNLISDVAKDGFDMSNHQVMAERLVNMKKISDVDASTGRMTFMRNGVPHEVYLNKDMAEAFSVLRPDPSIGNVVKSVKAVESVPRKATSLFLDLSMVGPTKDTFAAYINAPKEAGLNPLQIITNPIRGWRELQSKGDYFYEMVGQGGGVGGRFVGEGALNAEKTAKLVTDYAEQSGIKFAIMHPYRALEHLSADLSSATRMGMFMRLRDNGMTAMQSAVEARRVLADPFQSGSSAQIRALAASSSFMNTGLQEIRNMGRIIAKDPGRFALKGLVASAIPSAVAWSLSELNDDNDIRELRNAPGGSMFDYWRIGGKVVGTPRAWVAGQIFGTGMDTFLDAAVKGEDNKKRWAKGFLDQVAVNVVPLAFQQAYTMMSDQQFMGSLSNSVGVTPGQQQGMDPSEMGNSKTSGAAKLLADVTGVDPFKWDKVMKGVLTSDGYKVEGLLERMAGAGGIDTFKKATDVRASDIPMLSRYMKDFPTSNAASLSNFYEDYGKYSEANKTVTQLESMGRIDDLKAYVMEHKGELVLAPTYIKMGQELAAQRKMQELIAVMPESQFSPADKRQKMDQIQRDMIDLARKFNAAMKDGKLQ